MAKWVGKGDTSVIRVIGGVYSRVRVEIINSIIANVLRTRK